MYPSLSAAMLYARDTVKIVPSGPMAGVTLTAARCDRHGNCGGSVGDPSGCL
jgi:hypothetical protein